jgi:hypothetical protein
MDNKRNMEHEHEHRPSKLIFWLIIVHVHVFPCFVIIQMVQVAKKILHVVLLQNKRLPKCHCNKLGYLLWQSHEYMYIPSHQCWTVYCLPAAQWSLNALNTCQGRKQQWTCILLYTIKGPLWSSSSKTDGMARHQIQ